MVDGRRKGNAFEVEVAYAVSNWVRPVADGWESRDMPPPFRRRPADKDSMPTDWLGGRDLIHRPDVFFPFSVECKKYADWSIDTLFLRPTKIQLGWWNQCVEQADDIGLAPLLILGRNNAPPCCILRSGHWDMVLSAVNHGREMRTHLGASPVAVILFEDLCRLPVAWLERMRETVKKSPHAGGEVRAGEQARSRVRGY